MGEVTQTKEGVIFDAEDATIQRIDGFQKIILKRKVQVVYQGQHIACEEAIIDTKNKTIEARGRVVLISPEASLESEGLVLNYRTNTGEITNGFVKVGQVIFEGERIRKTGVDTYETLSGRYTSCQTCPEAWSISGSKVNAEIGGYAYIKNSVIRVGPVPFLWLPYLIVPLKSERQTGLLFPTYAFSKKSGFIFNQSLFWALSENKDITFTAKNYARRGLKGVVNHRYVFDKDTRGEFDIGFLRDKVFSFSTEDRERSIYKNPAIPTDKGIFDYNTENKLLDRWFTRYKHHYELPYGYYHNLDVNLASDTLYPRDFKDEIEGMGYPSLESRMSIAKNTDTAHFSVDSSYYQDLLKNDPFGSNNTSVHRLPEVNYIISPYRLLDSNLFFNLELNYLNLVRGHYAYDDLTTGTGGVPDPAPNDGQYNKNTDLIRTGQRLDIEPSLDYTFKLANAIDIAPSVSYRETRYNFSVGEDPSTYRRYARANLLTKTEFSRIYDNLKHVIIPEVTYTTIPWIQQPEHPFFGSGSYNPNFKRDQAINDSDDLQFDYKDRIYEKNLVGFAVTNKLVQKRVRYTGGPTDYKQIATLRLSQSYDFHESYRSDVTRTQPWSEVTSLLDVRLDNFETNSLIKYYPYENVTTSSTRLKLFNEFGDYIQLTYAQDVVFQRRDGSSIIRTDRTDDILMGGGFISKYVNVGGETTLNLIQPKGFQSYNYFVKLKPPGNCWAITLIHERPKNGDPIIRFAVSFLFDGKTETVF